MKYTESELIGILDSFLSFTGENEVVEFKQAQNTYDEDKLGEYFSALSNEANLKQCDCAWLIFGIVDKTHEVIGTCYKNSRNALDELKKSIGDNTTGRITFEEIYAFNYCGKRVVMFQIPPAPQGMPIYFKGHYYGRDGSSLGALNIQEIETIRFQNRKNDWSRRIVLGADMSALDADAIKLARERYTERYPDRKAEICSWTDEIFLDKAKITINGRITNAAILLLGKAESDALISPSVALIKWILKDRNGIERDYEIFGCPLIIAVEKASRKIRNLKYRYINPLSNTIVPEELDTYDPYVIREAINNAVAHQDYGLAGQINIVEFDDRLVFSNKGSFIPGSIDAVLKKDAPEENYRNSWLVNAMVNLKMVDTIGSGIKKMYVAQRNRLFPLPSYEISPDRVVLTISGQILDMDFSNLLACNSNLTLYEIELLNRVQSHKQMSKEDIQYLRDKRYIEGRFPHIFISKTLAASIGKKVEYSKIKGPDNQKYDALIVSALKDHGCLSRSDIKSLLWDVLPIDFDENQKDEKVKSIIKRLKRGNVIYNVGTRKWSKWFLV